MQVLVAQSCPTLWDSRTVAHQAPLFMEFFRQDTEVGSHSLLQGISPTQGSNPGLLHCKWILYQLRHQGSPGDAVITRYSICSSTFLNIVLDLRPHDGNVNVNDVLLWVQGSYEHVWISAFPCHSMKAAWTSEIPLKKICLACTWLWQE